MNIQKISNDDCEESFTYCTQTHIHTDTHIQTYAHLNTHKRMRTHTHTQAHTHKSVHLGVPICNLEKSMFKTNTIN